MNVNKQLEDIVKSLNISIKDTIEYKEYVISKRLLDDNDRLRVLKGNLESMKHLMCSCDDESIKDEYMKAREEYDSSPLVINYRISEEKLNVLIQELIKDIDEGL